MIIIKLYINQVTNLFQNIKIIKMKKILFAIKVNNVVDVITNSSSELFVLKGETKNIVEEMITNIYPNYKNEYEEVTPRLITKKLVSLVGRTADKKDVLQLIDAFGTKY